MKEREGGRDKSFVKSLKRWFARLGSDRRRKKTGSRMIFENLQKTNFRSNLSIIYSKKNFRFVLLELIDSKY